MLAIAGPYFAPSALIVGAFSCANSAARFAAALTLGSLSVLSKSLIQSVAAFKLIAATDTSNISFFMINPFFYLFSNISFPFQHHKRLLVNLFFSSVFQA